MENIKGTINQNKDVDIPEYLLQKCEILCEEVGKRILKANTEDMISSNYKFCNVMMAENAKIRGRCQYGNYTKYKGMYRRDNKKR